MSVPYGTRTVLVRRRMSKCRSVCALILCKLTVDTRIVRTDCCTVRVLYWVRSRLPVLGTRTSTCTVLVVQICILVCLRVLLLLLELLVLYGHNATVNYNGMYYVATVHRLSAMGTSALFETLTVSPVLNVLLVVRYLYHTSTLPVYSTRTGTYEYRRFSIYL